LFSCFFVPFCGHSIAFFRVIVALCFFALCLCRETAAAIADDEAFRPPTKARIDACVATAEREGWGATVPDLKAAAFRSYEAGYLEVSAAWLHLCKWAEMLGEPESEFLPRWMKAIKNAKLVHENMPLKYAMRPRVAIATWMPRELQARFAADDAFLDEFFAQLSPCDFLPGVLSTLSALYQSHPQDAEQYRSLALAIALVYDTPPPPDWPHGQVSSKLIPRKLPNPGDTLAFFAQQDRAGRTYQKLGHLGADELRFVVDIAASFDDLRWSQSVIDVPLAQFQRVYFLIKYRVDRARNNVGQWPSPSYALPQILGQGGICVDQAYFACQVGKGRGIPTLLFRGTGLDGRHAWFGYLDGKQEWQLNAGRYAEQRFVTGVAIDPQTWGPLTDHALQFISERFQGQLSARRSRIHSDLAREYLAADKPREAQAAARAAIKLEKRNLAAYEALSSALKILDSAPKEKEAIWREAIIAFQRYPDLESRFASLLVASLRTRGEKSMAEFEEAKLIRKYQGERVDISIRQSADILARSFAEAGLPEQIKTYNQVLEKFGKGAGMSFFDGIVVVFAEHLLQLGQPVEALRALERGRKTLRVEPGSQLEREFQRVEKRIRNNG
jgi:hypothetical protein